MTCQVLLEFQAKPNCVEEARAWLREVLPDTRGFDGCMTLHVIQNQDNPTVIVIIEQWATRQHYEKYLEWRTARGDMIAFAAMTEENPTIRFFDYFRV